MMIMIVVMLVVTVWKKKALMHTMGLDWKGVVVVVNRDTDVHIDGLMMAMNTVTDIHIDG